jgi:hypothetical protein
MRSHCSIHLLSQTVLLLRNIPMLPFLAVNCRRRLSSPHRESGLWHPNISYLFLLRSQEYKLTEIAMGQVGNFSSTTESACLRPGTPHRDNRGIHKFTNSHDDQIEVSRSVMELSSLLSGGHTADTNKPKIDTAAHSYPTRHTMSVVTASDSGGRLTTPPAPASENHLESTTPHSTNMSPYGSPKPKSVAFELLFPESPQFRARLPMRVQIFPHDTTDSIVTTVKNFYGLYAGPSGTRGISFEDEQGNTLIARYENLRNNMVVYVRVIDDSSHNPIAFGPPSCNSASPVAQQGYYTGDAHQMPPPQPAQVLNYGQPPSRPISRTSQKRSVSPSGRGRRSASASTNPPPNKKARSRSGYKSRGSSTHGSFADMYSDGMNGYSSGDGAPGSVSSRTKSEHLGNTEISLDNIVEGGRRKRAKFESSVSFILINTPNYLAFSANSYV